MKVWLALLVIVSLGGLLILFLGWLLKRRRVDLVSPSWLKQLRQGERDEFHGPTVTGPFGGRR